MKFGIVLWLSGLGFDAAATFYLDHAHLLHSPLAKACDAFAMALMGAGLVMMVRLAIRRD